MVKRLVRAAILPFAVLLLLAGCSSKTGTGTAAAPSTLRVKAGVNDPKDPNVAVLAFLPNTFTVKVGTTVQWTATGPEPHSVSFVPSGQTPPTPGTPAAIALQAPKPATGAYDGTTTVSSGLGPTSSTPMTFSLSFSKPGSYKFFCAIHAQMQGTVTVVTDASKAESQATVTQRSD